jgi:hypothetical protein
MIDRFGIFENAVTAPGSVASRVWVCTDGLIRAAAAASRSGDRLVITTRWCRPGIPGRSTPT